MFLNIAPFLGDTSYLALLLRLFLGASLIMHGYPKIKGGWRQGGQWMKSMGIPAFTSVLVTFVEFFGGILLVVGFAVPVVASFVAIQFACIIGMKAAKMKASYISMDANKPSYEIDVFYLVLGLVLVVLGAGTLSVDAALL